MSQIASRNVLGDNHMVSKRSTHMKFRDEHRSVEVSLLNVQTDRLLIDQSVQVLILFFW